MGRNSAVVNNDDPWLAHGDMGGENLGLGLLPASHFAGSSTGGNPFHGPRGMHRRGYSGGGAGSAGGSDSGLPGSFGAGSSDNIG
ncbi:hypothetical protein NC651_016715 [Populus alba x Populus x berolinensis]|nr:hypothetical protein NC651_016715 [Populus alba x Populus x berolinensis]